MVLSACALVRTQLKQAAEKIGGKEKHINKEFDTLGGEFREQQRRLDATQEQYNALTAAVAELTSDLAQRSDAVDAIKAQVCVVLCPVSIPS